MNKQSGWTDGNRKNYGHYPQYACFERVDGDVVRVHVRGKESSAGVCGEGVSIDIPKADFDRMVEDMKCS